MSCHLLTDHIHTHIHVMFMSPRSYSGSALGRILHHDPRAAASLVGSAVQEEGLCSLQWSPDGGRLASGSAEGLLSIWGSGTAGCTGTRSPLTSMKQPGAVKVGVRPWRSDERALQSLLGMANGASTCRRWAGVRGRETPSPPAVDTKTESSESGTQTPGPVRPPPALTHRCSEI